MKRILLLLILLPLFATSLFAQSTTVSGTITDTPDGQAWFSGTYSFVFRPAPSNPAAQYRWNGAPFSRSQTIAGSLDTSGHYSVSVPSSTAITPAGSTWDLTVCPLASASCFTVQSVSITGATQTVAPVPPSIRINMGSPPQNTAAYTDNELVAGALGQTYYNITDTQLHYCATFPCGWQVARGLVNVTVAPAGACTPGTTPEQVISTGVIYTCQGGTWSAVAASASAAAPVNILQKNIGGVLSPSNCLEPSSTLNCSDDPHFRGPNLGVDVVSAFGARVQNPNPALITQTTGTITGGTNALIVASNAGWQASASSPFGDGFSLVSGGATNCGTAPVAPTGFPAIATSATGTGWSAAGPTGANSASYVVVALSQGGCYTAASPILNIGTTFGTLGANNMGITSCINVLGTTTCTVPSTANLGPTNTVFYSRQSGTTDDPEFGGYFTGTVLNGTQYSFGSGISSLYWMSSNTSTGGTLYFWTSNHINVPTLPAGTNMYKEVVYRCYGASCALPANAANYAPFWVTYPLTLANTGSDGSFGVVDDYGTTMTPNLAQGFNLPWFVPTTPPASNVNDMLTTTITPGGISGTNFTIATNATNTVGATSCNGGACPMRFDNVPAWSAAQTAAHTTSTGGGGTVRFPPPVENTGTGAFCYVTSSFFIQTGTTSFAAPPCFGETVQQNGPIIGTYEDSIRNLRPTNSMQALLGLNCYAMPCIWHQGGSMKNLTITSQDGTELNVFSTSGNPDAISDVNFATGNGKTSLLWYYYNDSNAAFTPHFFNTSWNSSVPQTIGSTSTPLYISKNGEEQVWNYFTANGRGFYFDCNAAQPACAFYITMKQGEETQGPITPMVTLNHSSAGNTGGMIYLEHITQDSGAEPQLVNASTVGTISPSIFINGTNLPGSFIPLISGKKILSTIHVSTTNPNINNQIGINSNLFYCPQPNAIAGSAGSTGCTLPALNMATATYGVNHTLNALEGIVIASASGITFTLPHALAGQSWIILNPTSGTITVNIDSGTLSGNGATGAITVAANTGGLASCNGTNCSGYGFGGGGGGGSPGGSVNALQSNNGSGGFQGTNPPIVAGDYIVHYPTPTTSPVAPARDLVGVPINPQTGTTYIEGSANYQCDRGFLITASNVGAQTYTIGNPSGFCFSQNYFNVLDNINTGTVTETASGFTVNGGASFVTPPGWIRWMWSNGVNNTAEAVPTLRAFPGSCTTAITIVSGAFGCGSAGSVSSWSGDGALYTNVNSTGAVTATLGAAAANTLWGRCLGTSGTPSYCQITDAMLTAVSHAALFNASNVWAGLQDFSPATMKIPTGAGFTASATSMLGYDSAAKITHVLTNSADSLDMVTTATCTTTTNIAHATAVAGIYSCGPMVTADLPAQYTKFECAPGLGDGLNAIPAGTYLQFNCVNKSGVTWTITGISCFTDNAGTSTLNAANNAATGLLTGAVTCNNTKSGGGAAGTQSGTTTLANNDAISFTFVSDGVSKQTTWTVSLTQ